MELEKTEIYNNARESMRELFDLVVKYEKVATGMKGSYDFVLRIEDVRFACIVTIKLTRYNVNSIVSTCRETARQQVLPVLILAGETDPGLMKKVYDMGIYILDAAGNCYIKHKELMLFCKGQEGYVASGKETLSFKEPGLKVIYFILRDLKNVNLPFRDIQLKTGVGLATINKMFNSLKECGYLVVSSKGRYLRRTETLLSLFVDNYNRLVKSKNILASMNFMPGCKDNWADIILPEGMQWGGEPAAYKRDRYLFPEVWDIYSSVASAKLIARRIAVPASEGCIRVYRKFWQDDDSSTAPALIVYADLMGSGDSRCIEAAQRILENELSYLRK